MIRTLTTSPSGNDNVTKRKHMMKNKKPVSRFLLLLPALLLAAGTAEAAPKRWILGWGPSHWGRLDFAPYMEPAKTPQNTQWAADPWDPQHWIAQRGRDTALLHGFYSADVIRDQYVSWRGMPVLEVGPGFYVLGGQDKRRVTETLDHVYNITAGRPNGMYILRDWRNDKTIGVYTAAGLQLQ